MKDTAFDIISLNDNAVLVEGKIYKKNEVVKTIHTDIEGIASTSADLLPYGNFRIVEKQAPNGYLTDGAKTIDFTITENGKIVDLTDEAHSIYSPLLQNGLRTSTIPTLAKQARTVYGLELLNQTTAKVRCLTILTLLKNYALTATKAWNLSHHLKSWYQEIIL